LYSFKRQTVTFFVYNAFHRFTSAIIHVMTYCHIMMHYSCFLVLYSCSFVFHSYLLVVHSYLFVFHSGGPNEKNLNKILPGLLLLFAQPIVSGPFETKAQRNQDNFFRHRNLTPRISELLLA